MLKQLSKADFLALFDSCVHDAIAGAIRATGATAVVCFENQAMDSSRFGDRTAMCVGPNCTYKAWQDTDGRHLHDLPSMRQYPTCWADAGEWGDAVAGPSPHPKLAFNELLGREHALDNTTLPR